MAFPVRHPDSLSESLSQALDLRISHVSLRGSRTLLSPLDSTYLRTSPHRAPLHARSPHLPRSFPALFRILRTRRASVDSFSCHMTRYRYLLEDYVFAPCGGSFFNFFILFSARPCSVTAGASHPDGRIARDGTCYA